MKKVIFLLLLMCFTQSAFSQSDEDYVGEWHHSLLGNISIYANGKFFGLEEVGSWRVLDDGRMQVVVDIHILHFSLSEGYEYLIMDSDQIGEIMLQDNMGIVWEKFREFKQKEKR